MLKKIHTRTRIVERVAAPPLTGNNSEATALGPARRMGVCIMMAAVFLSGCALSQLPDHDTIVGQALPKETSIPSTWFSQADTKAVAENWLSSFNDPSLDALVDEALRNNPDLHQVAATVAMARQTVTVVGAQLYPQVGVPIGLAGTLADQYDGGSQSNNDSFYGSNYGYAAVSWEFDLWGRLRAERDASKAAYQATALDYAYARQSLAAMVAKSWYLAVETRQLLELARERVRIYSELFDLVQFRRDAGKVADLDVAEATAYLNTAASVLHAVQGQYSEAQRSLERLLGRYPAAELAAAETFTPVPPPVQAGLPAELLKRRPDLAAAEQKVLAAFRMQEAAQLALLPAFGFSLDAGLLSDRLTSLLRINPWLVHGKIGMKIPLYNGGALRAQVEIATAQQAQIVARYGAVALKAFYEVETALTNESLLLLRLEKEEKGLSAINEAVRIARTRYLAGAADMLTVLQLEERYLANQTTVIQLRNARLANRINLHLALGGGIDAETAANQ